MSRIVQSLKVQGLGAVLLLRLAKHLALLACLGIVGAVNGHLAVGQFTIFFLVVIAAIVRTAGHALALSKRRDARLGRHGP